MILIGIEIMTGGSMNMVLVVMPTLLAVLTTSAAIHLCNYWKHSGARDEEGSVIEATGTAWLPCFLAAGTTALLYVGSAMPSSDSLRVLPLEGDSRFDNYYGFRSGSISKWT